MANFTVTRKTLDQVVDRINTVLQAPKQAYSETDGNFKANIDNYHLSGAYGGVCLHRMHNESGGVSDVFQCGHVTKRDLYNRIHAFLRGIEIERTGF